MQLLVYSFAYPFLWLISRLPFRVFYGLSDFVFFLVYRVFRYRRKVVINNLKLVFPEKTAVEINTICKAFYRHMCDMFLEMIKTLKLNETSLKERYRLINPEMLQELEKNRSVLVLFPHYGNWEWSIIVNRYIESKGYAVYQKIGNVYFDRLIRKIRAKWNTSPITQKETVRTIVRNEKANVRAVYGIVSDQSPQAHVAQYWTEFMGIKVPIYNGPEVIAKRLNLAVLFARVKKEKRGYYSLELIPIAEEGAKTTQNEITDTFLRLTEEQIREEPTFYLWTHKRWKHKDKVPEAFS
ncbi:lysophospholipid acyltransferase family protein [Poritiphilus flavus]|uniref:Lipid A biosynthesis acyltransferase n=1 Tax=Poritiphilus flavus TaxID=2697053 RepID=A0A6L9EEP8_9FLAO|nr:lysophospholipid acyltransferase family protein [Poritiphilus flavus]NAS13141.1 lipid A biosynthesis acyltransferase [Poritiphilus flavus]